MIDTTKILEIDKKSTMVISELAHEFYWTLESKLEKAGIKQFGEDIAAQGRTCLYELGKAIVVKDTEMINHRTSKLENIIKKSGYENPDIMLELTVEKLQKKLGMSVSNDLEGFSSIER
jgi:hypothetical protein